MAIILNRICSEWKIYWPKIYIQIYEYSSVNLITVQIYVYDNSYLFTVASLIFFGVPKNQPLFVFLFFWLLRSARLSATSLPSLLSPSVSGSSLAAADWRIWAAPQHSCHIGRCYSCSPSSRFPKFSSSTTIAFSWHCLRMPRPPSSSRF